MNREIEITIDNEGNISLDLKGFNGKECEIDTKELEEKLGIVKSKEKKQGYNRKAVIRNNRDIRGNTK